MYIPFVSRFVIGFNLRSALNRASRLHYDNTIWNYAVERSDPGVVREVQQLIRSLNYVRGYTTVVALKMSSFDEADQDKMVTKPVFFDCVESAVKKRLPVVVDAEQHYRHDHISSIVTDLQERYNKKEVMVYKTYQMYRRDAVDELSEDLRNAEDKGYQLGAKLVRGAYHDTEKHLGHLFTYLQDTHNSYNEGVRLVCEHKNCHAIFATHNEESVNLAKEFMDKHPRLRPHHFAQLMGMADQITQDLDQDGYIAYKYFMYGPFMETLPYLTRRLYENMGIVQHGFQ